MPKKNLKRASAAKNLRSKKQKPNTDTRLQFPRFDDGDTIISLTSDREHDFVLHGDQLRRMSGYFASFLEWPMRFELITDEDGCQVSLNPDSR